MCDVRLFFLAAAIARLARHLLRQRLEERQLRGVVGRQRCGHHPGAAATQMFIGKWNQVDLKIHENTEYIYIV